MSVSLQAEELDVPVVRGRVVLGNVGYLQIDKFSSTVDTDTATELSSLTSSGIGGLVLDLRDNPGGYLDQTVNATGLFLPDPSEVMYTDERSGTQTYTASGQTAAADGNDLPMVVALDGGSASASEVMAGALKDHGRATLVGETTYGKNTGQDLYHLLDGDSEKVGVLRLTTLRWTTPNRHSARTPTRRGFLPDVAMTLPRCLHPAEVARRAIAPVQAKVSQVAITSLPVNGAYTPGQTVQVTVTFDPTVMVDMSEGTPAITLDVGVEDREAAYTSGSDTADGTTELVFEYTIATGDSDSDGIHIDADALSTGGGTIRRSSGLDALLAHDGVAADRSHAVTDPPTEVRLSVAPSSVDENSGPTDVTVIAAFPDGAGTRPADVVVSVSIPDNPDKYDSTMVEVIIPAGEIEASAYFQITPVDDSLQERNRRIVVGGTTAPGLTVLATTLTIIDDEGEPPPPRRPAPRPGPSGGGGGGGGGSSGGGGGGGGGGAPPPTPPPPPAVEPVLTFSDTGGSVHRAGIETIAAAGITRGCNPPANDRYCPDQAVTRAQMATFLARALKLPESQRDSFGDDDGTTHEDNINRLAGAGITQGCNPPANDRYCPDQVVTRAQMATFLARALALKGGPAGFTDISTNPHRAGIEGIAAAGITRGCNPPANDRYCPDRDVTRAQMATFLARLLTLIAPV